MRKFCAFDGDDFVVWWRSLWRMLKRFHRWTASRVRRSLRRRLLTLDKELFDAYNTCDLEKLGTLVADDLEFYHDLSGLATGKKTFLDAIKNNICGKVTRELVPGTLEVHPLKGYGAMEMGTHRFLHPWTQDHGVVGEGKFITLWQYKDGAWKMTRAISYDHGPAK